MSALGVIGAYCVKTFQRVENRMLRTLMGLSHVPLEPSHFTDKLLSVCSWCRTDLSPAPAWSSLPPAGRISNTDEAWMIGSGQGLKRSKWKKTQLWYLAWELQIVRFAQSQNAFSSAAGILMTRRRLKSCLQITSDAEKRLQWLTKRS